MKNVEDLGPPDPPMTSQEQVVAGSLSAEFVDKIDNALLANAKTKNRKVAMVISLTMSDQNLRVPGLPDLFYAQRISVLVEKGLLLAEGNLEYMRQAEIRLP